MFTTPNGDFGFDIDVAPNEDGSPGTLKATLDAEGINILSTFIEDMAEAFGSEPEAADSGEVEDVVAESEAVDEP